VRTGTISSKRKKIKMTKQQIKQAVKNLDGKNVHVETSDDRYFTGHLNLAGDVLIITKDEYMVDLYEVSSIREV
jgi:hypothetical protein